MAFRYCECGRKIVVFKCKGFRGVKAPKDNQHELCQQCYKSERDSQQTLFLIPTVNAINT